MNDPRRDQPRPSLPAIARLTQGHHHVVGRNCEKHPGRAIRIAEIGKKKLVDRPEWGTINFEQSREDIDTVILLSEELANLPLNLLTDTKGNQLYIRNGGCL